MRQFSWSGKKDKSESENLIESTALEWYEAKHRKASLEEINFINSIKITSCPYCNGTINKNGHRKLDGLQIYKCRDCLRKFNPLTGTIFDSHKIPISEWIEYLIHLFEFHSIKTSSFDNRNVPTTGKYWLIKVFEVLKHIQDDVVLEGNVYIDETFFPVIESKKKKKNGGDLQGTSINQLAVASGTDGKRSVFIYMKAGTPSEKSIWKALHKHIKMESSLFHDGEPAHNKLVDELLLKSTIYPSITTKGLKDKDNPLFTINDLHNKAKRFMREHGGYDRRHLQDWMNLFWFIMNGPEDKFDKVKLFIERAIRIRKRVKYRDVI